jgi:hypothetical protein
VSWNANFHISNTAGPVDKVKAGANIWHWYCYDIRGYDKKQWLRVAVGYVTLAWAGIPLTPTQVISASSPSPTYSGNGCRHVVNRALPANSVLDAVLLPCIDIHGYSGTAPPTRCQTETGGTPRTLPSHW